MLSRRKLLALAAAGGASSLLGGHARASAAGCWLGARVDASGRAWASAFDAAGRHALDIALPDRGHGFAAHPSGRWAVAFARRPGDFARIIDLADATVVRDIAAAAGRHFNGHGVFDAEGRRLFVTETIIASGDGVLGIYDVADGYRRLGEVTTHGLDPHEVRLSCDGRHLVVANGGLLGHPDAPGAKLNIDTMDPSLVWLDTRDGHLVAQARMPEAFHKLGTRHLALAADGAAVVVMQYEGPAGDPVPLVARHRPGEAALTPLALGEQASRALEQYCGSAAVDVTGTVLAVSSPRGGLVVFHDLATDRPLGALSVTDGCGLAAAGTPGAFVVSSGLGQLVHATAGGGARPLGVARDDGTRWDNHLLRLTGDVAGVQSPPAAVRRS
ncbi:MAG: DUF1513 domain-containing protein [Alphaproteobacteria bacterium]